MDEHRCDTPECELCGVPAEEREQRMLTRFAEMISQHGWCSPGVFDPEGKVPSFNYTVNFRPDVELIIVGLDLRQAHPVLSTAVNLPVEAPGVYSNVVRGYRVRAVAVKPNGKINVDQAMTWRRHTGQRLDFTLLQLLWPDTEGRFPNHPDYNSGKQPVLPPA